jgi:hypothetical protein
LSREVAAAERVARDNDERMITGLKGGSISQYLVLVEPALGSTEGATRGKGGIPLTAASSKSIPLSSFGTAYADSKASISSQSSPVNVLTSSAYNEQIKDLFWQNVDSSINNGNGKGTKNVYSSVADRRNDFYESFKKYVENKIQKGKGCIFLFMLSLSVVIYIT